MSILVEHSKLVSEVAKAALVRIRETLEAPSKPSEQPTGSGLGVSPLGGILPSYSYQSDPGTTAIRDALAVLTTLHGISRPETPDPLAHPNMTAIIELAKKKLGEGSEWRDGEGEDPLG